MKYYNLVWAVGNAGFVPVQSALVVAQQDSVIIGVASLVRDSYERSQHSTKSGRGIRLDIEVCDRAISDGSMSRCKLAAGVRQTGSREW